MAWNVDDDDDAIAVATIGREPFIYIYNQKFDIYIINQAMEVTVRRIHDQERYLINEKGCKPFVPCFAIKEQFHGFDSLLWQP